MNILRCTLLSNDRAHAFPTDIGTTINPTTVTDNLKDSSVVASEKKTVSTDSNFEVSVILFYVIFLFMIFFEVSNHFLNVSN